ncbi:MAG TPA: Vms1/Ankzf1 family peptidyl-tRNA hydrolase [Anaerolineae bacterium]|nr:Vms1/Ankzf1 family peptidyl-tRNA hydrolase [Anaerolineae bacterium]
MIDQATLHELVGFQSTQKNAATLSLYLDVDPRHRTTDEYRLALRHLLTAVDGQASKEDCARVERYIEKEYDRQSRSLVCFSCAAEDFWHAIPLAAPVEDMVFAGLRPYVKPLSDILDTYTRYGVVLLDREGGHLFMFHLGTLEGVSGVAGEDIKRHKQGGWAAARFQRREDEAAYRNLKEVVEMTSEFVRSGDVRRLILGGTDETVAQFAAMLPKGVQQLVVGAINADVTAGPAEVGEKSLALIREVAAARKAKLVDQLITTAAKGGPAALGLANTLLAVDARRARHLVLDDGFAAPALRCDHCGYVGVEPAEDDACPLCETPLRVLPDAADSLVRWAIEQDIDVTFVSDNADLQQAGAIGALLRY